MPHDKCLALSCVCLYCAKIGHWQNVYLSKLKQLRQVPNKSVQTSTDDDTPAVTSVFLDDCLIIDSTADSNKPIILSMSINNKECQGHVYTEMYPNLMYLLTLVSLMLCICSNHKRQEEHFSMEQLYTLLVLLEVKHNETITTVLFHIVPLDMPNILLGRIGLNKLFPYCSSVLSSQVRTRCQY